MIKSRVGGIPPDHLFSLVRAALHDESFDPLPPTSPTRPCPFFFFLSIRGGTRGRTICSLWWPSTTRSTSARGVRSWPGRPCMQVGCTGKGWREGRAGEREGVRLALQMIVARGWMHHTVPQLSISLYWETPLPLPFPPRGTFSHCPPGPPPFHTPASPAAGLLTPLASPPPAVATTAAPPQAGSPHTAGPSPTAPPPHHCLSPSGPPLLLQASAPRLVSRSSRVGPVTTAPRPGCSTHWWEIGRRG